MKLTFSCLWSFLCSMYSYNAQRMKFSVKNFFSKCERTCKNKVLFLILFALWDYIIGSQRYFVFAGKMYSSKYLWCSHSIFWQFLRTTVFTNPHFLSFRRHNWGNGFASGPIFLIVHNLPYELHCYLHLNYQELLYFFFVGVYNGHQKD